MCALLLPLLLQKRYNCFGVIDRSARELHKGAEAVATQQSLILETAGSRERFRADVFRMRIKRPVEDQPSLRPLLST